MSEPCPLPGCRSTTATVGQPCPECLAAFGDALQQTDRSVAPDRLARELADRDAAVARILTERRGFAKLRDPDRSNRMARVTVEHEGEGREARHTASCECGWQGERHVVKTAANDEARYHRAGHRTIREQA